MQSGLDSLWQYFLHNSVFAAGSHNWSFRECIFLTVNCHKHSGSQEDILFVRSQTDEFVHENNSLKESAHKSQLFINQTILVTLYVCFCMQMIVKMQ